MNFNICDIVFTYRFINSKKTGVLYLIKEINKTGSIAHRINFNEEAGAYEIDLEPIRKLSYEPGFVMQDSAIDSIISLKIIKDNFKKTLEEKCQDLN